MRRRWSSLRLSWPDLRVECFRVDYFGKSDFSCELDDHCIREPNVLGVGSFASRSVLAVAEPLILPSILIDKMEPGS